MGKETLISILIPVLGRPKIIEPLLENIRSTTDIDHLVVFICSPGDAATEVCLSTDATTIVTDWSPGPADFAKKINLGYEQSDPNANWFFQGATDLLFHQGWASIAMRTAHQSRCNVIGTNDLGNPVVKRGEHATHILFSREYIEKNGGTFDNTGSVFSTVYDHQYVDTEFVQTAKARNEFHACLRSVVEHMHPHWNKGDMDAVYEKALRGTNRDRILFNQRMRRMRHLSARSGDEVRIRRAARRGYNPRYRGGREA